MPFTSVEPEIVKLPGHAHFGIVMGRETLRELPGGNANGGVRNMTDSDVPQLKGWSGPVNLNWIEIVCVVFAQDMKSAVTLVVPPRATVEGDSVIEKSWHVTVSVPGTYANE